MRAHGGSDGGSGWFGGGVVAAPLPLPYCFGVVLLFISFAPSVNNVLPSLQLLRGGAGGGGLMNGLDGGRLFFFFFSVFFFLQLCSPLLLLPHFIPHGVVVRWEDSGSWR